MFESINISKWFHEQQQVNFPKYSFWKNKKSLEKTVIRGAKTVDELFRLDGWKLGELKELLKWVLDDTGFWQIQMKSLAPIRNRMKNGQKKIENARDAMQQKPINQSRSNNRRTPAKGRKSDYASKR